MTPGNMDKKQNKIYEYVQRKAPKMFRSLKHKSYKESPTM